MRGFFTKEESQVKGGQMKGLSCAACGLYKNAKSPRMKPYGNFKKGIMIIGEFPDKEDDARNVPWRGKAGRMLRNKCRELGIDLYEDCVIFNAVNCVPLNEKGELRLPTDHEIACCRIRVLKTIREYKPKVIILQGSIPTTSLIGYKWKDGTSGIQRWQGWAIPEREYNAWVIPTFHPNFIDKQDKETELNVFWEQDLKLAFSKINEPFPYPANEEDCIVITEDLDMVLDDMNSKNMFAFDIETTGLKPYDTEKHRTVCISFCNDENKAYALPFPTKRKEIGKIKELLENPKIGKIAANMKYEDTWLNILNGIHVNPWIFDTMLAAHILDNRHGITGLKFQSYVRFGLLGYDDAIAPYLKSENAYMPNRIDELISSKEGYRQLLLYNGIDSLMTYRLALIQMKEVGIEW